MCDIAEIYKSIATELETSPMISEQSLSRRISLCPAVVAVLAIKRQGRLRELFIKTEVSVKRAEIKKLPYWNGLKIDIASICFQGDTSNYIALVQVNAGDELMFEAIAFDVCRRLSSLTDHKLVLGRLSQILQAWKQFFMVHGGLLMTTSRQQGLYGELWFLRKLVHELGANMVEHWTGPNAETHDFYIGENAIEVKTTVSKRPYNAHISNENQLDNSDVPGNLFLGFLALHAITGAGEMLKNIVQELRDLLSDNVIIREKFDNKLFEYGYLNEQADAYDTGYLVRDAYFFEIREGFPRILRSDMRPGIGNISYTVDISACKPFEVGFDEMSTKLQGKR